MLVVPPDPNAEVPVPEPNAPKPVGFGAPKALDEPPPKRARTADSAVSGNSSDVAPHNTKAASAAGGLKIKVNGAAAVKPTETAVEAIAGKKKSKFWVR